VVLKRLDFQKINVKSHDLGFSKFSKPNFRRFGFGWRKQRNLH